MNEMNQEQLQEIMGLIIYAGNAKSDAMEAIQAAKKGEFELAEEKIKLAEESLVQAHQAQTKLLTAEANGEEFKVNLLTIHSQDHLMTSITFTDLAKEVIEVYKRVS